MHQLWLRETGQEGKRRLSGRSERIQLLYRALKAIKGTSPVGSPAGTSPSCPPFGLDSFLPLLRIPRVKD